eukprot:TRINITY_DN981_c0_g1_i1.p1 TRINITY_DN981_c0_g1~~TRINITY_DN981_c0_g1_i1.p1  ORF type:complete len:223 (-),score=51.15 TRINITY_DN981_c0_g1_i1:43-711(-)
MADSAQSPTTLSPALEGVEYLYKILVVGDIACGKTSVIHRYVSESFSEKYRATIGVDFALKVIHWDSKTNVRLQLWDIAGQERFGHMTRVYFKEAAGAIVVYDVTRPATFEAVQKWKAELDDNLSTTEHALPVILLANKCDLIQTPIDATKMKGYCQTNGFLQWFETSAKDGRNIDTAMKHLVNHILVNDPENKEPQTTGGIKLGDDALRDDPVKKTEPCAC